MHKKFLRATIVVLGVLGSQGFGLNGKVVGGGFWNQLDEDVKYQIQVAAVYFKPSEEKGKKIRVTAKVPAYRSLDWIRPNECDNSEDLQTFYRVITEALSKWPPTPENDAEPIQYEVMYKVLNRSMATIQGLHVDANTYQSFCQELADGMLATREGLTKIKGIKSAK